MIEKTTVYRFELGVTATDAITGFTGVVTGRADYLTGCNQYCLSPRLDDAGKPQEPKWFDETRLFIDTLTALATLPTMPPLPAGQSDRAGGPATGEGAPTR